MGRESEDSKIPSNVAMRVMLFILWLMSASIPVGLIIWIVADIESWPIAAEYMGTIGDFIGGISNPFISSLTFFALIMTILQNQRVLQVNEAELKETRREIELTREANEQQAIEFHAQNEIARNQSEIQTTTEAALKVTELVNNLWNGATSIKVIRVGSDSDGVNDYLKFHELRNPPYPLDLTIEAKGQIEDQIAELVRLIHLQKQLLSRLETVSPNNPMVTAIALLVKGQTQWVSQQEALSKVLGDLEAHKMMTFYQNQWH